MATEVLNPQAETWRNQALAPSLPEVYRSLHVPRTAGGLRKLLAFAGPGFLVAVGYMDPGNWATDLAGGSRYNYTLLSVIMLSNLMAVLLQSLAIKLGVVTGRDLAQACRDHFSRKVSFAFWGFAEIAIAACDLAEVIGSALALNLLFHIPLLWGVCLTALDVLMILFLQQRGFVFWKPWLSFSSELLASVLGLKFFSPVRVCSASCKDSLSPLLKFSAIAACST
jgi:manganese transport protein